jgi:hypothetical protein
MLQCLGTVLVDLIEMVHHRLGIGVRRIQSLIQALRSGLLTPVDRLGYGILGQLLIDQIVDGQFAGGMALMGCLGDFLPYARQEGLHLAELRGQVVQRLRQRSALDQAFDGLDPFGVDGDAVEHQDDGRFDLGRFFDAAGQQTAFDRGHRRRTE